MKELSRHPSGDYEKNHERFHYGQLVNQPKLEPGISLFQTHSATAAETCLENFL
jgi:hypothetical protein